MKVLASFVCLFICAFLVDNAKALTNSELFDIIEPYLEDIEEYDSIEGDDDDDVITLPGGPDDDVDVAYLIGALGITMDGIETEPFHLAAPPRRGVAWWHHHHHHHHPHATCTCHHDGCTCCVSHTFKVNIIFKTLKAHIKGCITVAYLPSDHGFELTFSINGHRIYHKEISLKHPPHICYDIPGMSGTAKACLELYDINFAAKHICARLVGILNLRIKKFKIHLKLGCFTIPTVDDPMTLGSMSDNVKVWMEDSAEVEDDVDGDSVELADLFRGLQNPDEGGDPYANNNDDEPLRF